MRLRTYSELVQLPTFEERFEYLKLSGKVGKETFGFDRYMNQVFYRSQVWKSLRNRIIVRDGGCDLGIPDRMIYGKVLIHHLNTIVPGDIISNNDMILNPEFLICVSLDTHNAIHYGDSNLLVRDPVERTPGDTCPWKKG